MDKITQLYDQWIEAKMLERAALERRRDIEDEIVAALDEDVTRPGSRGYDVGQYRTRIIFGVRRIVDQDAIKELAARVPQHDLDAAIRIKAEIDAEGWKIIPESSRRILSAAVTERPARPSFSISINSKG